MDSSRPGTHQEVGDALAVVYRTVRAWKFYPPGHPSRVSGIRQAHGVMRALLGGAALSLVCGRSGFSLSDGESLKDGTRLSATLSFELFSRRVRRITFLADLFSEDLLTLVRILARAPEDIQQAGGVERIMAGHGVRTIWVNELDLAAIQARRRSVEASGIVPPGVDELELNGGSLLPERPEQPTPPVRRLGPEEELQDLLARLGEARDDQYPLLVRQAIVCCDVLAARSLLPPVLPLVELLSLHADDVVRDRARYARSGLEQLSGMEPLLCHLLEQAGALDALSPSAMAALLGAAGQQAIGRVVEQLADSDSRARRKTLATLLVRTGERAVPAITARMADPRWFVIRNLAAVLGDIASPVALPVLRECLGHEDTRVRKEAIRGLAKIGGRDAEVAIIALLGGDDPLLLPQAVASLGGMRSRRAVPTLMQIVCAEDLFLRTLPLKIDALAALAVIGDSSVVPRLLELLRRRPLMARNRWTVLKIHVVTCLAGLNEPRALPVLRKLSHASGELGQACNVVIGSMERRGGQSSAVA